MVRQVAEGAADAVKAAELATAELAALEAEELAWDCEMQELVANFLSSSGKMHACGLLEYAEWRLFPRPDVSVFPDNFITFSASHQARKSNWGNLRLWRHTLEARILEAIPTWTPESIADNVVQLHSRLSALVHSGDMPATTGKVLLMEGTLSREEMSLLKCVADAVHCPCQLCYLPPSGAIPGGL